MKKFLIFNICRPCISKLFHFFFIHLSLCDYWGELETVAELIPKELWNVVAVYLGDV